MAVAKFAELATIVEPLAVVNPSEFVNNDVEVTPANVVFPVTFKTPATLSVPVTLDEAATNPPKNSAVVVEKAPRAITDCNVSRLTAAQFVPFARQTAIPPTKRLVVVTVVADNVPAFKEFPVAFPKVRVPIEPVLAFSVVDVTAPTVIVPVTPRDEAVALTSVAFPVTFNVPATFNVPVTLDEAATNPPRSSSVVVVKFPRAVTVANVSLKTVPAGQPTPLERQTAKPMTVAVAKFPEFAIIVVPLAVLNPSEPANNDVEVTPASVEEPVITNVPPFNAPTVAVLIFALVPEAAVKPNEFVESAVEVTPASVELPVTFKLPATFNVPVTLDEAATNPPNKVSVDVAIAPLLDTVSNVSDSAAVAGQFVPSTKQTTRPFTKSAVVVTVVTFK